MELISILILIAYVFFIAQLIFGFDRLKPFEIETKIPTTTFSILIPFRNEENFLLQLLTSLSKLNYPAYLFEIILIDDASDDASVTIFEKWKQDHPSFSSRILQNNRYSNSPKKDAITTAVHVANNQWIISTDADCSVPENWLLAYDNYIQKSNFEMIAGIVITKKTAGFLAFFQSVDFLSLQGTTIGSFGVKKPFMCNGANFGYSKQLFLKLDGFHGNNLLASGDDVFLLQKAIQKFPEKVGYLKCVEAMVTTNPETNWLQLFQQRVRWASKTGSYFGLYSKVLAITVLTINLVLVVFLMTGNWKLFVVIFGFKFSIDFILLSKTSAFVGNKNFFFPLLSGLFYPFFMSLVGIYSLFGRFDWKGRSYCK